ncbi:MAG TPA: hypothetical protein VMD05_08360 [Candidatus Nanoarchaeia archaeon]|nr:hypothetical protein [Candidatus Nanoarchaeia archaeon]
METKINWSVKIGLLFVSASLFSYMMYEFTNGIINRGPLTVFFILVTDTPGCIGMASRAAAGLIALVLVLSFMFKKDLTKPEAFMALRFVVLFEAGYWFFSFFMSGVMGGYGIFNTGSFGGFGGILLFTVENTVPCFLQSVGLVAVLLKLFFELNPNKPARGAIKWGLIAGTFYIFVFWFNNTGNWMEALIEKGTNYIMLYPFNLFSFLFSTIGLLLLGVYAAHFTKKSVGTESLSNLNLQVVGAIITIVGLYFGIHYVSYMFLGAVGGWGTWYAWMLGHNLDLWAMALPFIGLPLLFRQSKMQGKLINRVVLLTQGIGAVFFAVFWAAYAFALPSNHVLHGEPIFKIPLSIFGGLFVLLTAVLLVFSFVLARRKTTSL